MLNGYLLTLASLILLGGSLGDRIGRRRIFVIGVAWFTAASLLCAVAPSAEALIVARLLQGVGGALLTPGSLAMIEASFRRADRARAIGAWSGLTGVARGARAAARRLAGGGGVVAGGLPDQPAARAVRRAWRRRAHVPETRDPTPTAGSTCAARRSRRSGSAGTTYALIEAPRRAPRRRRARRRVGGVLALVAFIARERRAREPDDAADDVRLPPVQRREPR